MKITTDKRAALMGLISAITTTLVCIIFTYVIYNLIGGRNFNGKDELTEVINGISFVTVQNVGIIISAIISAAILRYNHTKFLPIYLTISVITYIALFYAVGFGTGAIILHVAIIDNSFLAPLNGFDYLQYALIPFPLGAAIGTIASICVNEIRNYKTKNKRMKATEELAQCIKD